MPKSKKKDLTLREFKEFCDDHRCICCILNVDICNSNSNICCFQTSDWKVKGVTKAVREWQKIEKKYKGDK